MLNDGYGASMSISMTIYVPRAPWKLNLAGNWASDATLCQP